MRKVCLFLPFLGQPTTLHKYVIYTWKYSNVSFFILTDMPDDWKTIVNECGCKNIVVIKISRQELVNRLVKNKYISDLSGNKLMKLGNMSRDKANFICGLRPLLPFLYYDICAEYDYVGWLDHECLLGNINDILTSSQNYDLVYLTQGYGPFFI
jgi:hypothetical protein